MSSFSLIKRVNLARPINSYAKFRTYYGNFIRNRLIQKQWINFEDKQYLNVGCGSKIDKKFINLDYNWLPGIDLCWDITKSIPLLKNSQLGIYTEHCLEHISYHQTKKVLSNFFDLLKPGRTLRLIVPDAEIYLDAYKRQKNAQNVDFPYGLSAHEIPKEETTPMMAVNSVFRGHGHQFAYDYFTLKSMLERVGFVDLKQETFRKGRDNILLIDSQHRACESLYVEATKPEN